MSNQSWAGGLYPEGVDTSERDSSILRKLGKKTFSPIGLMMHHARLPNYSSTMNLLAEVFIHLACIIYLFIVPDMAI